jgi:hypothetical protein
MVNIALPRDVLIRIERRWMAQFSQAPSHQPSSMLGDDPLRSPRVRRLLEGSLRPPTGVKKVDLIEA